MIGRGATSPRFLHRQPGNGIKMDKANGISDMDDRQMGPGCSIYFNMILLSFEVSGDPSASEGTLRDVMFKRSL